MMPTESSTHTANANPYPSVTEPKSGGARSPVTLRTLNSMAAAGEAFACLAAYDATSARLLESAGVHVLLLGDSAAQVILGHDSTVHMPFELTVELTAALKRGAPTCHVMADMPFGSYGVSETETIRNAMTLMTRGRADSVKLEVGASSAPLIRRMTEAGIPVCAHVGLRPTQVGLVGSYRAAGRDAEGALRVLEDALALQDAGAVLLLVEAVPTQVTEAIVDRATVPVIGIGAGPAAHGQILVVHDLVGLSERPPRFAAAAAEVGQEMVRAGRDWVHRVAKRDIGGSGYSMPEQQQADFQRLLGDGSPSIT